MLSFDIAENVSESSLGTNVNVCTTYDFMKPADALAHDIDPKKRKLTFVSHQAVRQEHHRRARHKCSILTLTIGNNQGMGDVEYGKIYDIYFPPAYLRLFDGPATSILDMWRILGRSMTNGGLVVGTIVRPKLGFQPKPFWRSVPRLVAVW